MMDGFRPERLRHMGMEEHCSDHFPQGSVQSFSLSIRLRGVRSSDLMGYPQRVQISAEISFIFSSSICSYALDAGALSLNFIDPNFKCIIDSTCFFVGEQRCPAEVCVVI